MTVDTAYVTLDVLKGSNNIDGSDATYDAFLEQSRGAASRAVDVYCKRRFWANDTASVRLFMPILPDEVLVDDFFTATGLVVKSDTNLDGSFATTWAFGTDYALEPTNGVEDGIEGVPFRRLVAVGSKAFELGRDRLQVTAKWGWAEVPTPVAQAATIVASAMFRLKDAPLGTQGWSEEGSPLNVRGNPRLRELLDDGPYCRRDR